MVLGAIVAMVGTNWGAKQYRRAREIAWTGAATVATTGATIGLFAALFPQVWLGLFSSDEEGIRVGTWYLQIVGPIYGCYGLGLALHQRKMRAESARFCDPQPEGPLRE